MPSSMIKPCAVCGKDVKSIPSKPKKFCSHACYHKALSAGAYSKGRKLTGHCAECGKPVYGKKISKSRTGKSGERIFCNRSCYDKHRADAAQANCAGCGRKFHAGNRKSPRKYCSHECRVASKRVEPVQCIGCGCTFTPIKFNKSRGKYTGNSCGATCSDECWLSWISNNEERKAKISAAFSGENHPRWRGGRSLFHDSGKRGPNWKKQRQRALERDGRKCQECGVSEDDWKAEHGYGLDVDHIVPYHNFLDWKKANTLSNLVSLCRSCHISIEWKGKHGHQCIFPFFTKGDG